MRASWVELGCWLLLLNAAIFFAISMCQLRKELLRTEVILEHRQAIGVQP